MIPLSRSQIALDKIDVLTSCLPDVNRICSTILTRILRGTGSLFNISSSLMAYACLAL